MDENPRKVSVRFQRPDKYIKIGAGPGTSAEVTIGLGFTTLNSESSVMGKATIPWTAHVETADAVKASTS